MSNRYMSDCSCGVAPKSERLAGNPVQCDFDRVDGPPHPHALFMCRCRAGPEGAGRGDGRKALWIDGIHGRAQHASWHAITSECSDVRLKLVPGGFATRIETRKLRWSAADGGRPLPQKSWCHRCSCVAPFCCEHCWLGRAQVEARAIRAPA